MLTVIVLLDGKITFEGLYKVILESHSRIEKSDLKIILKNHIYFILKSFIEKSYIGILKGHIEKSC